MKTKLGVDTQTIDTCMFFVSVADQKEADMQLMANKNHLPMWTNQGSELVGLCLWSNGFTTICGKGNIWRRLFG